MMLSWDQQPPYSVDPSFRNVTASVAHQNDHASYMTGTGGLLASMPNMASFNVSGGIEGLLK